MIETITPAGCGGRRGQLLALFLFWLGTVGSGALVGAALGWLGQRIDALPARIVAGSLLILVALAALDLVRSLPQRHGQVPEHWRRTLPLAVWAPGYGAWLGTGVLTYQAAGAGWAAWGLALATADPTLGALIGIAFGVGRAAMVLPALSRAPAAAASTIGRHWRPARRALAGVVAAAAIGLATLPAPASAASGRVSTRSETTADSRRVSVLLDGQPVYLAENAWAPSIDGPYLAVQRADSIDVVRWTAQRVVAHLPGRVSLPSLSWPRIAFRAEPASGPEIRVRDLSAASGDVIVEQQPLRRSIGRPSLLGKTVAWQVTWSGGSEIRVRTVGSHASSHLVLASRVRALRDPALGTERIAWVSDTAKCSDIWMAPVAGGAPQRVASRQAKSGRYWNLSLSRGLILTTIWKPGVAATTVTVPARADRGTRCSPITKSPLRLGPPPLPKIAG